MPGELQSLRVGHRTIEDYSELVGAEAIAEIRELAEPIRRHRVLYVNASGFAGRAGETARTLVPLLNELGIEATWSALFGEPEFFAVARQLHDALQGGELALDDARWANYLAAVERNAAAIDPSRQDTIVVSDAAPAPLATYAGAGDAEWVWRCWLDASEPDAEAWERLLPFVERYDTRVFSMPGFVPPDLAAEGLHVVAPAIDPLAPKNMELPWQVAGSVLRWLGVDLTRPLVCHVLRFDAWKDPLGVIEAWRLAASELPGLQLALVGMLGQEDTEGWRVHGEIADYARGEPDLHVFTNYTGVGGVELNAFQRLARCAIQGSLREGFGLAASETLYKGTPVVAADTGGLPAQVRDGLDGYLFDSAESCAERVRELVRDPGVGVEMGASGREHVRARFLVTRLLADELRMLAGAGAGAGIPA